MFRSKKKKYKLTLNERGIQKYSFNFEDELDIYTCLCLAPGYKKKSKRIDERYIFNSYNDWEKYIQDKYSDYNRTGLIEFSRYLNQRLRNIKPGKEIYGLFIPVVLTLIVEEFVETFLKTTEIVTLFEDFKWGIVITYAVMMILFVSAAFALWNIISPLWKDNLEENFITDYKEIIDDMIKEKEKCKKNNNISIEAKGE